MKVLFIISIFFASLLSFSQKIDRSYKTEKIKLKFKAQTLKVLVHYPKNQKESALRIKKIILEDFTKIHEYFGYMPQSKVHIISKLGERSANGSAAVFPGNVISLHDYPPTKMDTLSYSTDWTRILLVHEYIHILTLERTSGVLNFFRNFLGSTMKWTAIMPFWLAEGMAMWGESHFTSETHPQGRIHFPLIKSQLKKVFMTKGSCKHVSCFDSPKHYPFGQFRYWVGGFYLDYLERKKIGTVACISKDRAKRLPLFLKKTWSRCVGESLEESFLSFRKSLINDSSVSAFFCPLENQANCAKLEKKFRFINWFKGFIEDSSTVIFADSPSMKGHRYGQLGERLIIVDRKKKKIRKLRINYVISKIYKVGDHNIVSVWVNGKRKHLKVSLKGSYSFIELAGNKLCDQVLKISDSEVECAVYENSRWNTSKVALKESFPKGSFKRKTSIKKLKPLEKLEDALNLASEKSVQENPIDHSTLALSEKNYQPLRYVLPQHLLLNAYFGNVFGIGAETTLSDPLLRHNLLLNLSYNSGIDGVGLPLSSVAQYSYLKNDWSLGGGYSKFFGQSIGRVNTYEGVNAFLSKSLTVKSHTFSFGAQLLKSAQFDTLLNFDRKSLSYGLNLNYSHSESRLSSFYRSFNLRLNGRWNQNKDFDPYYSFSVLSNLSLNFSDIWKNSLSLSYEKLLVDKSVTRFRDGVIYGGGINSFFTGNFRFPSFHFNFQQIFGDEMLRINFETSRNIWAIFKPVSFFGTHLRNLDVFLGQEFIKSDFSLSVAQNSSGVRVFQTNSNPNVFSTYMGLRLKLDFMYVIPLQVDFYTSFSPSDKVDSPRTGVLFKSTRTF